MKTVTEKAIKNGIRLTLLNFLLTTYLQVIIEDPRNQRKYAFKYDNWIYPGNHKILEPST